jgi:hypothetical protein
VVDELEGGSVGLTVSPWPGVDERGRLVFDLAGSIRVGARASRLRAHLARHRVPAALKRRELRIGDVFAVTPGPEDLGPGEIIDPARWMQPPVIDISADARDVAKLSFFAAVTPLLSPQRDRPVIALAEGPGSTIVRGAPSQRPPEA